MEDRPVGREEAPGRTGDRSVIWLRPSGPCCQQCSEVEPCLLCPGCSLGQLLSLIFVNE